MTPFKTILHLTTNASRVRLKILHARYCHSFLLPPLNMLIPKQAWEHQRTVVEPYQCSVLRLSPSKTSHPPHIVLNCIFHHSIAPYFYASIPSTSKLSTLPLHTWDLAVNDKCQRGRTPSNHHKKHMRYDATCSKNVCIDGTPGGAPPLYNCLSMFPLLLQTVMRKPAVSAAGHQSSLTCLLSVE